MFENLWVIFGFLHLGYANNFTRDLAKSASLLLLYLQPNGVRQKNFRISPLIKLFACSAIYYSFYDFRRKHLQSLISEFFSVFNISFTRSSINSSRFRIQCVS